MPLEGQYVPSPTPHVVKQVCLYESTGGKEGWDLEGVPCVILTTKGRKSGKLRKTPLMRVNRGDTYVVVASMGGAPKHPVWYLNLVAEPSVMLQDGAEARDYTARTATDAEKEDWWPDAVAVWPPFAEYRTKTDRNIPVVILEPAQ